MTLAIQLLAIIGAGFVLWLAFAVTRGCLKAFVREHAPRVYACENEFDALRRNSLTRIKELEKGLERAVSLIEAVASTTQNHEAQLHNLREYDYNQDAKIRGINSHLDTLDKFQESHDCRIKSFENGWSLVSDRVSALEAKKAKSSF